MADKLRIFVSGAETHVFDKREGLARMQFAYVQRMQEDMDRGITFNGERLHSPTQDQRTQYVIGQLLEALLINDSRGISMLCRYLAQHAPGLNALHVEEDGDEYSVELDWG